MKVCIVTGGSGGHIYPAITFADTMRKRGHDVFFIGNDHKMESWIVPQAGYPFHAIHNNGLQGTLLDKFKAIVGQYTAFLSAKKLLKSLKPDCVVAFGGYVSAPVSFAASSLKIALILHEQNAFPGKANKMVAKRAQALVTCYPEAFQGGANVHYLGNPRASLVHEVIDSRQESERIGLRADLPLVLIVMGSQGSTSMNAKLVAFVKNFNNDDYQVIVTTGPKHVDAFKETVGVVHPNVKIEGFVDQKALLPRLDLIVCRSGASTIAEIQAFAIASILIPSPYVANNHQFYNAQSLLLQNACVLLEEKDIHDTVLNDRIHHQLFDRVSLEAMRENVKKLAMPHASDAMADLIEDVVGV